MPSRKILLTVAAIGVPIVAYLAIAVFGVQTLFVDKSVDEAGPVFATEETTESATQNAGTGPSTPAVEGSNAPSEDTNSGPTAEPATEELEVTSTNEIAVLAEGSFIDKAHASSGVASVLNDGSSQRFLRFEDFETDNGPDLFVYLTSADAAAGDNEFDRDGEFINLGELKGNIGDQNYEIPVDVDLDQFDTVVIWCRRFSVSFGAADLV